MDVGMDQPSRIDRAASTQNLSSVSLATCVVAGAWAWLAISCWAVAAWTPAAKLSPSWLTVIAIASVAVSAWCRFYPADLQQHSSWQRIRIPLALITGLNWFGFILIRSPEPLAAAPSLLILGFAELGMFRFSRRSNVDTRGEFGEVSLRHSSLEDEALSTEHLEKLLASERVSSEDARDDQLLGQNLTRTQQAGTDERGQRNVSGELYCVFEGDQRVMHTVVGFQPAFSAPPDIELESENADISVELQNCTPVGMRLQLKLDRSAKASASTVVAFYATASSETRHSHPAPLP